MGRTVVRVFLAVLVWLIAAFVCTVGVFFFFPYMIPAHDWHPRSVYYRLRGIDVHPFVPVKPDEIYELTVWDMNWPPFHPEDLSYKYVVEDMLAGFQERYPNTVINYRLFPYGTDMLAEVTAGLKGDEYPDVYIGPPLSPDMADELVPVTCFHDCLTAGKSGNTSDYGFPDGFLGFLRLEGELWGWPRWISPYFMVANRKLAEAASLDLEEIKSGWTWEEFLEISGRIKTAFSGRNIYTAAFDDSSPVFFISLALNSGLDSAVPGDAGAGIRACLEETALFLGRLKSERVFPPGGNLAGRLMELVCREQVVFFGPAGPPFLRLLWEYKHGILHEKGSFKDLEFVLLPFPTELGEKTRLPVELTAVQVLRGPADESPAGTRLAVELAHYLAITESAYLAARLKFIPAHTSVQRFWEAQLEIPVNYLLFTQTNMHCFSLIPPSLEAGADIWRRFWQDQIDASQVAAEFTQLLKPGRTAFP